MRYVKCYHGIGDTLYSVPVVDALSQQEDEIYVETPFPEIFQHLGDNIFFVRPPSLPWRTQAKMVRPPNDPIWYTKPLPRKMMQIVGSDRPIPGLPMNLHPTAGFLPGVEVRFGYGMDKLSRKNIIQCFESQAKVSLPDPIEFRLPDFTGELLRHSGLRGLVGSRDLKIALVRPPTDRREWFTPARQCKPEYVNRANDLLRERDYLTISIADVENGKEWLIGPAPNADIILHKGELDFKQLLGLSQLSEVIVGGIGWIVPVGIAVKTNLFMIFGGRGGYDSVSNITDVRMDLSKVDYALPKYFCNCVVSTHHCNKEIPDFEEKFIAYLDRIDDITEKKEEEPGGSETRMV